MAIAQTGIAFRSPAPLKDLAAVIARAFGEPATELASPVSAGFDTRLHSDVMVQTFGDVCFISNDDLAGPLLQDPQADATRLLAALGQPRLLMAFCHDPAAGRHGYTVLEHAEHTRSRLQNAAATGLPPLVEHGAPLPFERRWLAANHFVELRGGVEETIYYLGNRDVLVPRRELTARLLQDGMLALFGICPWETLLTASYRFFHVGPDAPRGAAPSAPGTPARRRGWQLRGR